MSYDIADRFRLALNPERPTTIETTLHALCQSIDDAKNAGGDPDMDPGVALLAA